jgi:CubicO group peptidase (beta-lactamase class C family)
MGFEREGFWGTVLVGHRGQVVLLKGYGFADSARRVRNSPATRFEMNSITKTFTAAAILQLAAAGRLAVSDPLELHLGPFPPDKRQATIDNLATHTAGLVQEGASLDHSSRDAFVESMKRTPLESAPGSTFRYTNAGFSLLAAVVERASGERFEDYLRKHLFAPTGLRTVLFRNQVPADDPQFARGYSEAAGTLVATTLGPLAWGTIGAGGIWSTAGDIYRWVLSLEGSSVVPASTHHLLFVPRPPPREGYGWHRETQGGHTFIHKGGGSDSFASQILYYPDDRLVIVWASNRVGKPWRQRLNRTLPALALQ